MTEENVNESINRKSLPVFWINIRAQEAVTILIDTLVFLRRSVKCK